MLLARLLPAALCSLLMGAHAMRSGWGPVAVALFALAPLLLAVRRRWVPLLARLLLLAGALEWLRTAWTYAAGRAALGQPAARLWAILGGVAAFHVLAAALLSGSRVRRWFEG
jgi:hypothetical protein